MFVAVLLVEMVIFVIAKLEYADAILSIHNHPNDNSNKQFAIGLPHIDTTKTMETRKNEAHTHTCTTFQNKVE